MFVSPRSRLAVATLCLGLASAALAAPTPDYGRYTTTQVLSYENPQSKGLPFTDALKFQFKVDGKPFHVTMDTGSTGVVLSAKSLPGYSPELAARYPLGWEFLSSSKRLWVGRWIPKQLTFTGTGGVPVTAQVPVLAVEREVICPNYKPEDEATCPGQTLPAAPDAIAYMGVGFGREHDHQPQGTPDKNPFLNISEIAGKPVAPGTMRSGYVITAKGVHVGLTAQNTGDFGFIQLTPVPDAHDPRDPRDWAQAPMCVSVNQSPCMAGSVLVDTGIPQMYLTVTSEVPTHLAPSMSGKDRQVPVLDNTSQVTVSFPDDKAPIASYSFSVQAPPQTNPLAPAQVITTSKGKLVFVNTGRYFLRGYDVLFDAEGGLFGLKKKAEPSSSSGGEKPKR